MTLQEIWAPVVKSALDEYLSKKSSAEPMVVPAAPLKPLVVRHAQNMGLAFPPQDHERLKFIDFLDLFPSVIRTRRRPGQDALVVKAANADLLEKVSQEEPISAAKQEQVSFRSDVFNAFTKILPPGQCHWYSKVTDKFLPYGASDYKQSLVQVPSLTLEEALTERRDFADTAAAEKCREQLLVALNGPEGQLGAFSGVVKAQHLERAWHVFRVDRIAQRIDAWTKSSGITRSNAWECGAQSVSPESDVITARETNAFLAGLMQLGPDDAKRVMVPLDIVLKLMRRD